MPFSIPWVGFLVAYRRSVTFGGFFQNVMCHQLGIEEISGFVAHSAGYFNMLQSRNIP